MNMAKQIERVQNSHGLILDMSTLVVKNAELLTELFPAREEITAENQHLRTSLGLEGNKSKKLLEEIEDAWEELMEMLDCANKKLDEVKEAKKELAERAENSEPSTFPFGLIGGMAGVTS